MLLISIVPRSWAGAVFRHPRTDPRDPGICPCPLGLSNQTFDEGEEYRRYPGSTGGNTGVGPEEGQVHKGHGGGQLDRFVELSSLHRLKQDRLPVERGNDYETREREFMILYGIGNTGLKPFLAALAGHTVTRSMVPLMLRNCTMTKPAFLFCPVLSNSTQL